MIFDFDPTKDEANRRKHGVSLLFGIRVFDDRAMALIPTIRQGDEEERHKAIGLVEGKLYTVIHVSRGETTRLISVRRSNDGEQRDYDRDSGRPE
jgi:uncharacterized protein